MVITILVILTFFYLKIAILLLFFDLLMVPTGTGNQGKPGKMGRHFPVREFCQDWKSQGILLKILEKLKNNTGKLKRILEKSGKFVSQ